MMEDDDRMGRGRRSALRGLRIAGFAVLGVVGAAAFALAFGYFVMLLWNWLMPPIFGLGQITYWQAFGIVILAKLLFGALGGGRHGPGRGPLRHPGHHWRHDGGHTSERGEKWRYYRDFWKDEGQEAFDKYVDRRTAEETTQKS
jgi:hypothetical protein